MDSLIWTSKVTVDTPSKRSGAEIVYLNNTLYLFGGSVNDTEIYMLDLTGNTWKALKTTGDPPLARQTFPIFAWNDYIYVFPGFLFDLSGPADRCYTFDLFSYQWDTILCDISRIVWAYVGGEGYIALFGGATEIESTNGLIYAVFGENIEFLISAENWVYPPGRLKSCMLKSRSHLWVFGGYSDGK